MVTSRDSLGGLVAREGAQRVHLDRMSTGEAHRLITELLGDRCGTEPEATEQLIERCARLPLALRLAAERIREHPHDLAALVAELADEQARLDLLDSGDDPDTSVRAVFYSSCRGLAPEAARLFRLFGVHPGRDIDVYGLTALTGGGDLRTTRRLLDTLKRANLVDETADRRYVLHDLLATYAAELANTTDTPAERTAALARLLDYYLRTTAQAVRFIAPNEINEVGPPVTAAPDLSTYDSALRWLDAERANLVRAAEAAAQDLPARTTSLARVLSWYFDVGMYLDEAKQLQGKALDTAREHGDLVAEGIALRTFGLVHLCAHRLSEAEQCFEESLALHEKAGAPIYQATTLNHLGALCGFAGRAEDGIRHLSRSAGLFLEHDQRLMAQWPLTTLGQLHLRQAQPERALPHLQRAFAIADGHDYPPGRFKTSYALAGAYRDIGRYRDALDCAHRALDIARCSRFPVLEVQTMYRLGTIHLRLGDYESALQHHRQALAAARDFSGTQLEAMALNGLAETHAAAGAPAEVIRQHHLDALASATNLGARYEQARAHAGLGDVHERQGEHDKATQHWQQALTTYHDLRAPKPRSFRKRSQTPEGERVLPETRPDAAWWSDQPSRIGGRQRTRRAPRPQTGTVGRCTLAWLDTVASDSRTTTAPPTEPRHRVGVSDLRPDHPPWTDRAGCQNAVRWA
ncbi:tetratricopeptide repeat protein [Lentzea sp. NEAU-D13]|uniref:Tetratricopeptide repeat protein n=1 Tax=Lentzea alba TaxID=2714351 RepID=A0A7C9VYC1_9PSEU|nr:tetratricopeptide repeat protein [Lentzea alba]NGY65175.1 tetratricopeptide repeat protein [Lentzea alba]